MDSINKEISVVGAGIVGICSALQLQALGYPVHLLDRGQPGAGCSKGNAGHLAYEHIFPLSSPQTLMQVPAMLLRRNGPLVLRLQYLPRILPWMVRFLWAGRPAQAARSTDALIALNAAARAAYSRLEASAGLQNIIKKDGTLVVFSTEKAFADGVKEANIQKMHGVNSNILSKAELREFDSILHPDLVGGIYYGDSASVTDPYDLATHLFDRFIERGGKFTQTDIESVVDQGDRCTLSTSNGAITSAKILVTAGAWSKKFAMQAGHKVPLDTERGYNLTLQAPSHTPKVPTTLFEDRFVATPMNGRLRLAGRVELGGLDLPMDPNKSELLFKLARKLIPDLDFESKERWMGFRPSLPDSLPVIDRSRIMPNIYFAFGHHHLGLTQAAITGELIAAMIDGAAPALDLSPYRIDRF